MKLYNVPRYSWIRFEGKLYLFHKIDGMFSLCAHQGRTVHLSASANVEFVGEFEGFAESKDRDREGFGDEDRIREGFEHIEGKEYK
jgi:hypothetical protein